MSPDFLPTLRQRFGQQCSTAAALCEQHGSDEGSITAPPPMAVVFAESTQDVQDAVRLCAQHGVPIIAYGAGTSLEGHLLAVRGGISLDVSRMNQVLQVHAEDMTVTVQPGIRRKALNEAIKDLGLFFPIDPGADATIGGMTATRASGTNAVRYGTMRENVLALQAVTASGDLIRTGNRAKKAPPVTTSRACWSAAKARWASSPKSPCACTPCPRPCAPPPAPLPASPMPYTP